MIPFTKVTKIFILYILLVIVFTVRISSVVSQESDIKLANSFSRAHGQTIIIHIFLFAGITTKHFYVNQYKRILIIPLHLADVINENEWSDDDLPFYNFFYL